MRRAVAGVAVALAVMVVGCTPEVPPPPAVPPPSGALLAMGQGVQGPSVPLVPSPPPPPDSGAAEVGFDELACFRYVPADLGGSADQIPAGVQRLDGRRVAIEGHMLVLDMEGDLAVRRFVLTKYQFGCCGFGRIPTPNEWVVVEMVGPPAPAIAPQRVRVIGLLEVGREIADEAGSLLSIYRLRGDVVEPAPHGR